MKTITILVTLMFAAPALLADATVEQKAQFQLAGPVGSIVNVFSRTARNGAESTIVVKGNRKLTRTGSNGELIDLDQEKVYTIDFEDEVYTVKTFAEMRKEWEEQQARAKKNSESSKTSKAEKKEGPEYEVDFQVKSTGKKETINGWDTHQEIATVTVREKGKKLEQSGGFLLTSDMWMGPKVPAMKELADFDRRFVQKVYGPSFSTDMRQLAAAIAMTPEFGKAMKTFADKRSSFEGTPIRTTMKFVTVAGTDQPKEQARSDEKESDNSSAAAAAIGGLFNKMKNRRQAKTEEKPEEPQTPGHSELFKSTVELSRASSSAAAGDVALPSKFKKK